MVIKTKEILSLLVKPKFFAQKAETIPTIGSTAIGITLVSMSLK